MADYKEMIIVILENIKKEENLRRVYKLLISLAERVMKRGRNGSRAGSCCLYEDRKAGLWQKSGRTARAAY